MFITYPDVDNLSACGVALAGVPGRGGEAAGSGVGGEGVGVGAGVPGRGGEAAGVGDEGVARMWIG